MLGERAYTNLAEAPGTIDHAFVMTPGDTVELTVEDVRRKRGIPVATIFTDGFAETGPEGAARQARLVARARALGVRLLGPNSMGVIDIPGRVALTVNAVLEMDALPAGTTSVVSQSGTMLGTVLSRGAARGLGFAKLVVGRQRSRHRRRRAGRAARRRSRHARHPAVPRDGARRRAARRRDAQGARRREAGGRVQARALRLG